MRKKRNDPVPGNGSPPEGDWFEDMTQSRLWSFALGVSVGIVGAGFASGRFSLGRLDGLSLTTAMISLFALLVAWQARRKLVRRRPHARVSPRRMPTLVAGVVSACAFAFALRSGRVAARGLEAATEVSEDLLGALLVVALVWTLWLLFYELKPNHIGKR